MHKRFVPHAPQSARKTFHDSRNIFPINSRDSNCLPPFLRYIPRKEPCLAAAKPKNHPQRHPPPQLNNSPQRNFPWANEVKVELREKRKTRKNRSAQTISKASKEAGQSSRCGKLIFHLCFLSSSGRFSGDFFFFLFLLLMLWMGLAGATAILKLGGSQFSFCGWWFCRWFAREFYFLFCVR